MDFIKPGDFGGKFRLVPADLEPAHIFEELADQLMREKESACYEEFAASIRKHFPGITCTGATVAARIKELLAAEKKLQSLEKELAAAMAYISTEKDCKACKHNRQAGKPCMQAEYDCCDCSDWTSCPCGSCYAGSKWEWRGAE